MNPTPMPLAIENDSGMTATVSTTGTGAVFVISDVTEINSAAGAISGSGGVVIHQSTASRPINLGTETTGQLSLTDAELDRVTGSLFLGDGSSGTVTVSNLITRPAAGNVQLTSAGDIVFSPGSVDTAGGTLTLSPGSAGAVRPGTAAR